MADDRRKRVKFGLDPRNPDDPRWISDEVRRQTEEELGSDAEPPDESELPPREDPLLNAQVRRRLGETLNKNEDDAKAEREKEEQQARLSTPQEIEQLQREQREKAVEPFKALGRILSLWGKWGLTIPLALVSATPHWGFGKRRAESNARDQDEGSGSR